jgi:rRNA processing protein Gar1
MGRVGKIQGIFGDIKNIIGKLKDKSRKKCEEICNEECR